MIQRSAFWRLPPLVNLIVPGIMLLIAVGLFAQQYRAAWPSTYAAPHPTANVGKGKPLP